MDGGEKVVANGDPPELWPFVVIGLAILAFFLLTLSFAMGWLPLRVEREVEKRVEVGLFSEQLAIASGHSQEESALPTEASAIASGQAMSETPSRSESVVITQ